MTAPAYLEHEAIDNHYYGGCPFDEIVMITHLRQAEQGPTIAGMRNVLQRYNGSWVVPVPDMANEPTLPATTPALIAEVIDFNGMRAGSVSPYIGVPALDPAKATGTKSLDYADRRRRSLAWVGRKSNQDLIMRRFFRHLSAYATGSLIVVPDFDLGAPRIEVRDPLASLPSPRAAEDTRPPENIAYVTRHAAATLRRRFPKLAEEQGGPIAALAQQELWEMVEWVDADCVVLGLIGPLYLGGDSVSRLVGAGTRDAWMEVRRWPNRAGCVPVCIPTRVTLDGVASAVANIVGSTDLQAKLLTLDILAQEKAIFPDIYALGRLGQVPTIVGGAWKDGRTGDINLLDGVEGLGTLNTTPSQRTGELIDRLERNARISTGLVPQAGGETYGALRTGRGIDSLMGIAVDPRIQELHVIAEACLPYLNEAILSMFKGYWPDKSYSLHTGWAGDMKVITFLPGRHVETLENIVSYAIAGADVQQTTLGLGQLYATKAISLKTLRSRHPWIPDPESEGRLVEIEELENAVLTAIAQQLAQGQLPYIFLKTLKKARLDGADIIDALDMADSALREWQATQAPPPQPGQMAAPEAQPGFAAIGPAAQQAPPPALGPGGGPMPGGIGPTDNQQGLAQVMQALRQ